MTGDRRPSMATGEGQALAFVEALTSLRGGRRVAARVASGALLLAGCGAVAFGAAKAFAGAFT